MATLWMLRKLAGTDINELDARYALKNHTHDDYALKEHTHEELEVLHYASEFPNKAAVSTPAMTLSKV